VALEAIRDQAEAVEILRRAIESGRVAHAYAFIGPPGVGRRATALAFAKDLVAPSGGASAARVDRGLHPDVQVIGPTPPTSNPKGVPAIRVDNVRELERMAALRPAEAAHKVFIVDEAESMTGAAPQAFLKTLEEPPARTVIVLILSQARALPATVLSRCQIVRFRPRAAEGVALLPSGADRERALDWLAQAQSRGPEAIIQIGEVVGRDREMAEGAIETCWLWFRDLLCAHAGSAAELTVFAGKAAAGRRTLDEIVAGLSACREAWLAIQGNVSPRLTVEVLLSRLTRAA